MKYTIFKFFYTIYKLLNYSYRLWHFFMKGEYKSSHRSCSIKKAKVAGQGDSETPSNQAFERVKVMTIVNASDIFGKFFNVKFFILKNVIAQMSLSVIYQTRASFFWSARYTQRYKHLLGIYAVVNQVSLRPKEIIHIFVT